MAQAELSLGDRTIQLPIVEGTEAEKALDISALRKETGFITLDNGFVNTGSCQSQITFIDGEKGILRYRGYPIEEVCEKMDFYETMYLLIMGQLPSQDEYDQFVSDIAAVAPMDPRVQHLLKAFPDKSHPMSALISATSSLAGYYAYPTDSEAEINLAIHRLLAKLPVLAATQYRISQGREVIAPKPELGYAGNFLHMMFADDKGNYEVDSDVAKALDMLFILHADHEQNCSTATVRVVGSSQANLYASITGGLCSLWGPLHGGANQSVIEMLTRIQEDGGNIDKYLAMAKDKDNPFRLMGFGHRVYKNFDPRARIIKKHCDLVLDKLGIDDPLLDLAKTLERKALEDDYFAERKLYPNVDFYSGIIYKAMKIPTNMFTVMFAIGRLPGWIAQWRELMNDPKLRIGRPRQVYQGSTKRKVDSQVTNRR